MKEVVEITCGRLSTAGRGSGRRTIVGYAAAIAVVLTLLILAVSYAVIAFRMRVTDET
jgi:ABC-type sugar transport system permease subunit